MNDYFVFIVTEKASFPIDWMCQKLKVSRASFADSVVLVPALQRPGGDPGLPGEDRERDLVFDMESRNTPPLARVHKSPTR